MRMRKRHNLEPRMARCAEYIIDNAAEKRGKWLEAFPGHTKLYVELGCGKGRFTADTAETMPDTLLLAVEKVPDAMVVALERVRERGLENVRFLSVDAAALRELFNPGEAERIYINFCDPWPKSRDAKLRLTAPSFLRMYADVLPIGGEIHFKTDNDALFDWSLERFTEEGWEIRSLTRDLHKDGVCGVMTDYEAKFYAEGVRIKRLVAVKTAETLSGSAGQPPRLRNASLRDSRGFEESRAAHTAGGEE